MCIRGKIRKRLGKLHTFSSRIVDKWNSLTEVTITAISINIFKSRLSFVYKQFAEDASW
jgi:ABC-type bacteriocin/lantibiotic exporter with double-glycine peptidase domain